MARPLRIQYANACYHIINRGDNRRPVFSSDRDYSFFIERMSEYSATYNIEIYAYALMNNHFHLYLCTPEANLTRFMQPLLTSYSMYRNKTEGTSGHVFQGRYKSVIVEHNRYALELSRYIHLNPIRTQRYADIPFKDKRRILRSFRWSSYPSVIGLSRCQEWLDRSICYRKPGSLKEKQIDYAEYVEEGLLRDIENPMNNIALQSVLGSDSFIEKIRCKFISLKNDVDCPQAKRLSSFMELETLAKEVADYYKVDREVLFAKFRKNNEPRQMLLYLSKKYCRGRYPLVELAKAFGLTVNSLGSNTYKFQKSISTSKSLNSRMESIRKIIDNVKYEN